MANQRKKIDPRRLLAAGFPCLFILIGIGGYSWRWSLVITGFLVFVIGWWVGYLSSVGVVVAAAGLAFFSWWAFLIWVGATLVLALGGRMASQALLRRMEPHSSTGEVSPT